MPSASEMFEQISKMTMRHALLVCHLFMDKVEADGGVAAVQQDMKERFGKDYTADEVKHMMTCGGSIILMMIKEGAAALKNEGALSAGTTEREDLEAQREAQSIIERIRKLH